MSIFRALIGDTPCPSHGGRGLASVRRPRGAPRPSPQTGRGRRWRVQRRRLRAPLRPLRPLGLPAAAGAVSRARTDMRYGPAGRGQRGARAASGGGGSAQAGGGAAPPQPLTVPGRAAVPGPASSSSPPSGGERCCAPCWGRLPLLLLFHSVWRILRLRSPWSGCSGRRSPQPLRPERGEGAEPSIGNAVPESALR